MAKRIYGEGSVTQRKDGRYQVSVPGSDGKRRYGYADTPKDAERLRRQMLADVEQGKLPASKQLFQVHAREWLETKRKLSERRAGYKPSTYIKVASRMDAHFIPAFGHIPLNKLSPSHIQKLISKWLDQKLSPNTIREYMGTLSACLDSAVKLQKIENNPCSRVELPRKVKSKNNFLAQDEALQLLEAVKEHKLFSVLVPLALATEARLSELLALTWDDVGIEQGTVSLNKTLTTEKQEPGSKKKIALLTVTPKSESGIRVLDLPEFAVVALRAHRTGQIKQQMASGKRNALNLLFPSPYTGSYYWSTSVSDVFSQFARKQGFNITFHDLRHTGATLLLESGVDPNTVKERLGHSDVGITLGTYGHVTKRMKDQSVNTLDNLFSDQKKGDFEAM
jgi:integrase